MTVSGEAFRARKYEVESAMKSYNKNFVVKEYAYNRREDRYGEITMQNLAGMYVDYTSRDGLVTFRTHWGYNECILFDDEKEMLVHKLKNSK